MARITVAALALTACGALHTEPLKAALEPMPGDWRQLGQTGKAMTDTGGTFQFGADVAAAEAAAVQAREDAAAAVAAAGTDSQMSARQMDAYMRHAESQVQKEQKETMMLDRVTRSMGQAADAEERAVEGMEREVGRLGAAVSRDLPKAAPGRNLSGWVESDDQREKRLDRIRRRMDQMSNHEEGRAAKLIGNARKQVDKALAKERMYEHRRGALQHETQLKLAEQADAVREQAVAKGTLSLNETLELLDMAKPTLFNITITLDRFAKLPPRNMTAVWIEEKLDTSRSKTAIASAKMLEAVKHKVETFRNHHSELNDHQFLSSLSRTLNETQDEIKTYESTKDYLMSRLEDWDKVNEEKLTLNLAHAIRGVTDSVEFRSHLMRIDTARLANAHVSEACGDLTNIVSTSMAPAYHMLVRQKEKLDNLSRIVPSVTRGYPDFIRERMGARANALLNMAYMENLAFKEIAMHITQDASPVVMSRLHCTMRSASARSGFGLLAVLAGVVAWLAQ